MEQHLETQRELTVLLRRLGDGDSAAESEIFAKVYQDLRRTAHKMMRSESSGHTLQPTALVNEAYIRLIDQENTGFENRRHFFAIAARVMRRVLVDSARAKHAEKRGGASQPAELIEAIDQASAHKTQDLVELDQALTALAQVDERAARVIEMRVFGGYELQEISDVLNSSLATTKRDLTFAKAWLAAKGYV